MNGPTILQALDLPAQCLVDQLVPKKMLIEHGAPTSADRKLVADGVGDILWVATLRPSNVGVPAHTDAEREYLEIAVLRLAIEADTRPARLVELVHRAIPYPVLLLTEVGELVEVSAVHKRWAQNEPGKTVLDGEIVTAFLHPERDVEFFNGFKAAMAMGLQRRQDLYTFYQGWMDTLIALRAARITGQFRPADDVAHAEQRRFALQEVKRLDAEIAVLRSAASKARQIARQVELNLQIKRLEAARADHQAKL